MTELLSPAGNMQCLTAALAGGADAVYVGGTSFSARAYADNFGREEMIEAIRLAHLHHRKLYLTVNTLVREQELAPLPDFLLPFYEEGLDGVIAADLGVISYIHEYFPDLPIHASTQMTLTGPLSSELLKPLGISRIVPARELSLAEIRNLKEKCGMELEIFIHGAMCYCYSGQCLMSSMLGRRSGNRGRCGGPCRLPYQSLCDGKKIGKQSDEYPLSLKDLCALPILDELMDLGIDSFKIEGRMKSPEYVYFVTSLYRKYMDRHVKGQKTVIEPEDADALTKRFNRGSLQTGYFKEHNGRDMVLLQRSGYTGSKAGDKQEDELKIPPLPKVGINGELYLQPEMPAHYVCTADGRNRAFEAGVRGGVVQKALNTPLEEDLLREKFSELGNTEFELKDFKIFYRENDREEFAECQQGELPPLFLPLKDIKDLKRRGAEALFEELLAGRRRQPTEELKAYLKVFQNSGALQNSRRSYDTAMSSAKQTAGNDKENRTGGWFIRIRTMDQLRGIPQNAGDKLSGLILSYELMKTKGLEHSAFELSGNLLDEEGELYLALPPVTRQAMTSEYDKVLTEVFLSRFEGVICGNLESVAYLISRGYEGRILTDSGLYVFQSETAKIYEDWGITHHILPYELQKSEIRELLNAKKAAGHAMYLPVYGYIPVMVSAGCIRNTAKECLMEIPSAGKRTAAASQSVRLKDRMGKEFPVVFHCDRCENTIYNTVPLSLHKELSEIETLPLAGKILSFTIEDGKKVAEICNYFLGDTKKQSVPVALKDFTRGHYQKGVE
ncbi:MAG: U32 family peptidase [Lachnospiraceae bacterium]|nr:U32 family peptidase [Lachnospiraceae bacterium]